MSAEFVEHIFYCVLSVLIMIPLILSLTRPSLIFQDISSNKFNASLRLCSIFGYVMAQILLTALAFTADFTTVSVTKNVKLVCASLILWVSSKFMLLIYFINRFYYAFLGTKYILPNSMYNLFYTAAFIYFLSFLYQCINVVLIHNNCYSFNTAIWTDLLTTLTGAIVDVSLHTFMLFLLIKKILLLIADILLIRSSNTIDKNRQNALTHRVTKYFILLAASVLSSFILLSVQCLSDTYDLFLQDNQYLLYPPHQNFHWLCYATNILWQIDCVINAYCLFFEREYNDKYYNCLCKKMLKVHSQSEQVLQRLAERKSKMLQLQAINMQYQELDDQ
eukprot:442880_1